MKPFWNVISLALPIAVAVMGTVMVIASHTGTGDYVGRIGSAVVLVLAVGAACLLGEAAAAVSLFRGEQHAWLGILGLILNLIIILPIAGALMID